MAPMGLVQLVRERRRHLAHRAEARDVNEFRLQFLQARLHPVVLGEIVDETGEVDIVAERISPMASSIGKSCRPAAVPSRPGWSR